MSIEHRSPQGQAMGDPEIARLSEADWRVFAELRLRALTDTLGADDSQYREEITFTAAQWRRRLRAHAQFIAIVDAVPIGLIGAQRETADTVYLYSLWLEPRARGRGVGRALVAAAVDWARHERARSVTLRVNTDNAAARVVYEGLGFRITAAESPVRTDELMMSLSVR